MATALLLFGSKLPAGYRTCSILPELVVVSSRWFKQPQNPTAYKWLGIAGLEAEGVGSETEWHHAVLTQLTGNVHFYLDGNLDVVNSAVLPDFDDIVFWPNTTPKEFGVFDEVTVWTTGFTTQEYLEPFIIVPSGTIQPIILKKQIF